MTNYYNKMIDLIKSDNGLADKQEFMIVTAATGIDVSKYKWRWNDYSLEFYSTAAQGWVVSNTYRQGLFTGDWGIKKCQ